MMSAFEVVSAGFQTIQTFQTRFHALEGLISKTGFQTFQTFQTWFFVRHGLKSPTGRPIPHRA